MGGGGAGSGGGRWGKYIFDKLAKNPNLIFGGRGERTRGREGGVIFLNKGFTTVKNGRGGLGEV